MADSNTPIRDKFKMSSSLKERLRKLGRYHGITKVQLFNKQISPASSEPSSSYSLNERIGDSNLSPSNSAKLSEYTDASLPKDRKTSADDVSGTFSETSPLSSFKSDKIVSSLDNENTQPEYTDANVTKNTTVIDKTFSETSTTPSHASDEMVVSSENASLAISNAQTLKKAIALWKLKESQYEETLRKLKLVKVYKNKNNLSDLDQLIVVWRTACQSAISSLLDKYSDPKPTLDKLLNFFNIDYKLIGYDPDTDSFM